MNMALNKSSMIMTAQEYADLLHDNMKFDELIDEMYWERDFSSTKMFKYMMEKARESGVILEDAGNWDYDEYFYELYKGTEKGLS